MSLVLTDQQVQEVINDLQGTCRSLSQVLESAVGTDDISSESIGKIEEHIRECPECNWWMESDDFTEVDGDEICNECADNH